ncbi:MAG: UDP-N-acetylmuramate dehydrogenase [Patescibacteria group bacterium]
MFDMLSKEFPEVWQDIPLAPYTTFKIGGPAEFFFEPKNDAELARVIRFAQEKGIPVTVIAGGSNLVVSDGGVAGLVVRITYGGMRELGGVRMECDAGVSLGALITHLTGRGLEGLESLSGIPGTVGGAVVGNAGAYGQSISGPIEGVRIFDGEKIRTISKDECEFAYRNSIFKRERAWVLLSVRFRLEVGKAAELKAKARTIITTREKKYIPGLACPGSYFKNVLVSTVSPETLALIDETKIIDGKIPTGYLLETVGARGLSVGAARVAEFHGNLIWNEGDAMAEDVRSLAEKLKVLVKEKYNIALEEEIRYIGF